MFTLIDKKNLKNNQWLKDIFLPFAVNLIENGIQECGRIRVNSRWLYRYERESNLNLTTEQTKYSNIDN